MSNNLNDAASCFSTGGAGFTRLFQNNYLTNRAEESNEDGLSDEHKITGVLSMEDEEGGDEERDDKTQGKVSSGKYYIAIDYTIPWLIWPLENSFLIFLNLFFFYPCIYRQNHFYKKRVLT